MHRPSPKAFPNFSDPIPNFSGGAKDIQSAKDICCAAKTAGDVRSRSLAQCFILKQGIELGNQHFDVSSLQVKLSSWSLSTTSLTRK
jgi:hypothetical protein